MRPLRSLLLAGLLVLASPTCWAEVLDIATRSDVKQRLLITPAVTPTAVLILFAGGHGGLRIDSSGKLGWGEGNFLVRSAPLFAARGLVTVLIDAPSDRQSAPFLSGYRQTAEHAEDIKVVIAQLRERFGRPVWLVGTSRGTQSVAAAAVRLNAPPVGPDGIVLTASIVNDPRSRSLPAMALERLQIPVLVVHHEQDGCRVTLHEDVPPLMRKLSSTPRAELATFTGGVTQGDPCQGRSHHGFYGIEEAVVDRIAAWITGR